MAQRIRTARQIRDLLRLTPRQARTILRRLEEEATRAREVQERRQQPRYAYPDVAKLVVRLRDEFGCRDLYYAMIARNLSAGGMALLHGQFVYPRTPCMIHLQALDGRVLSVRGFTVHCRVVEGRVHELGVRFETPIEPMEVLALEGPG